MSKRYPRAKWVLPAVVHPDNYKCFKVSIPNDPQYIAAFKGAMLSLGSGAQWADDPDHKAREVAEVMRAVYDNLIDCSGGLIPIACPYDFQFGDQAGWHPIFANGIYYASWTGAGWQSGYQGTTPGQPYYQLQIYHDIPSSEVYSYTITYTCTHAVQANVAPDFSNQGPYPAGVNQVIVVATTGTTSTLRVILTTIPQTDPGTHIVVTSVIVNLANSSGACS